MEKVTSACSQPPLTGRAMRGSGQGSRRRLDAGGAPPSYSPPQTPQPRRQGNSAREDYLLPNRTVSPGAKRSQTFLLHLRAFSPGASRVGFWSRWGSGAQTTVQMRKLSPAVRRPGKVCDQVWVLLHYLECSGPSPPP